MTESKLNAEDQAAPSESASGAPPSALEVLDRIEAEKAAQVAGAEKPAEAVESKDTTVEVVNIVNVVDASQPAGDAKADPEENAEAEPKSEKEIQVEVMKKALARCAEITQEIAVHERAIKVLKDESSKLVRDIKHAQEFVRPPLHELNRQQREITAAERNQRFADLAVLERLGAVRQKPRSYPPKFKTQ